MPEPQKPASPEIAGGDTNQGTGTHTDNTSNKISAGPATIESEGDFPNKDLVVKQENPIANITKSEQPHDSEFLVLKKK